MSMFNDISCDRNDNKDECFKNANYVKTFAGRFGIGQWSFIGPGSEKKWYPSENSPQGEWDHIAEQMLLEFAESGHPISRATTPLSRGKLKSKGRGKLSIRFAADQDTVDTIYRIILSVNQLSVYGSSPEYRVVDKLMVIQWYSSAISSQDSPQCSLSVKSKIFCED